jgi:tetratricopeptide (TPR) repeat protein
MNTLSQLAKAEAFLNKGRPESALPLLRAIQHRSKDKFLQAEIIWRLAESLRALGRFQEALNAYWRSHKLYRLCRVEPERARTLLGASACLRILGRYRQAYRMWTTYSRLKIKIVDPSPEEIQVEIALVERGLGRHARARRLLRRSLPAFQRRKDGEALQHTWWALGGAERFSGRLRPALLAFQKAEHLARRLGDASSQAYALCGQAGCLRLLGEGKKSFAKYRQAYRLFHRRKDLFGQAYGLCGMGNAERVWGDARKTLSLYEQSRKLYVQVGDEGSMAFALWGLGGSLRRLGNLTQASRYYEKSLVHFKKVGDRRGVIMALLGLARVRREQTRRAEADRLVNEALRLSRQDQLIYETALCLVEKALLHNARPPYSLLQKSGISPHIAKRWKDLP